MTEKFRVVCYQRESCGPTEPLTWRDANRVREQLQRSNPQSFYVIEEVRKWQ